MVYPCEHVVLYILYLCQYLSMSIKYRMAFVQSRNGGHLSKRARAPRVCGTQHGTFSLALATTLQLGTSRAPAHETRDPCESCSSRRLARLFVCLVCSWYMPCVECTQCGGEMLLPLQLLVLLLLHKNHELCTRSRLFTIARRRVRCRLACVCPVYNVYNLKQQQFSESHPTTSGCVVVALVVVVVVSVYKYAWKL